MIAERLLGGLAGYAARRPWTVLAGALLAVLLALGAAAWRLELKTSNLDLVDPDLPPVRAFRELAEEFGTPNVLVVVLEGEEGARLAEAARRLAPPLRRVPGVRAVLDGLDGRPFTSEDGGLCFLFVQPADATSSAATIAPMVEGVLAVLEAADLGALGARAGLTGLPRYALDDRDVIQHDISVLSLVSFGLVLALFAAAFGALRRPLLAMLALLAAVVAAVGFAALWPGHLTLLSAFFASILFGLGVDFGIHIIDRVEELVAAGVSEAAAIPAAVEATGRGLATGALTTAGAFFTMLASGFRGFAELGLIAGVGLLLCLLAMVTVLPALLVLLPPPPGRERRLLERRLGRVLWRLQSRPLALVLTALAVAGLFAGGPGFDSDYLNLQPRDSEAVRLEREMVRRSGFSPQFAAFVVDSKAEVRALSERLLDDELVGEVHSIADLGAFSPFGDAALAAAPEAVRAGFESPGGRYAVYAYPRGDVWDPAWRDAFLERMRALDPGVTGMPFLGQFMVERSRRALRRTALLASFLILALVWVDLRDFRLALLAALPALLAVGSMHALMRLCGIAFNPLNVMALPVVVGIAVDDGVHLTHRYLAEGGDPRRTLAGTGRAVVLTSATTLAAFAALAFTSHRGLASFALSLSLGVTAALALSVLALPALLAWLAPPSRLSRSRTP